MDAPATPHHLLLLPPQSEQPSSSSPTVHAVPASTPPLSSPHPVGLQFDRLNSSSSSSLPEIAHNKNNHGLKRRKRDSKLEKHGEKRKQRRPPDKPNFKGSFRNDRRGCQENVCCKCAAGLTADCAALCCCPFALLHLLALTFIKLPSAVVWRMLVSMKNRLCSKNLPLDAHEEDDDPRPSFTPPWSYKDSPEGSDPFAHVVRFDSQKLWKHFEAGHLGFGGLSMKRD